MGQPIPFPSLRSLGRGWAELGTGVQLPSSVPTTLVPACERHHPSAGTRAKALRLQEMTELGSRQWQWWGPLAPPGRRAQPVPGLASLSLPHDEWANKGPLFPMASPQRPWLHHWTWGAGGHWRKWRGHSQRHPTPRLCAPRKGPSALGSGPAWTWIC